jgi:hypothetical protein
MLKTYRRAHQVTKDDDVVFGPTDGIYIGGEAEGDLVVIMAGVDKSAITFSNIQPGTFLPIAVETVMESSTADPIIALYYS